MQKAFIDTNILLRLIIKDNEKMKKDCEELLNRAKRKEVILYLLPVAIMEIVWVLEKFYRLKKKMIQEIVESILNTPEIKCEMEDIFRNAIKIYADKNIKFADAVMGCWGLSKRLSTVYTYDVKDFRKIKGLTVKTP